MTKIRALSMLKHHLEQEITTHLRTLPSHGAGGNTSTRQQYQQQVGLLTILAHQVQQHLLRLYLMSQACYHAQAGTEPTCYDAAQPYDPYEAMRQTLVDDTMGVPTLSDELQTYVNALPPISCDTMLPSGSTCHLPEHAFGALVCGRAQLQHLAYYDQDLQALHTLVGQRGHFELIQSLL